MGLKCLRAEDQDAGKQEDPLVQASSEPPMSAPIGGLNRRADSLEGTDPVLRESISKVSADLSGGVAVVRLACDPRRN